MSCGSHCRYMINDFPYALNILAFEVFPAFRGFSKYKAQKLLHMLCSGPSKQPVYRVIIDNFFHAEHRFSKYNVNVVATEQERQNYPVSLQFTDDPGSCSSSVTLPSRLFDHIVDGVVSNLKKKLNHEHSTIINQVMDTGSRSDSRFEELDKKWG